MGRDTLTAYLNNTISHPGINAFYICGLVQVTKAYEGFSSTLQAITLLNTSSSCKMICLSRGICDTEAEQDDLFGVILSAF